MSIPAAGWSILQIARTLISMHLPLKIQALSLFQPSASLRYSNRVLQQRGEDAALQIVAVMYQGQVETLSAGIAIRAAKVGSELKLPLADSVILELRNSGINS